MSDIIGVEAAKLAGLQIDMNQKLRAGQLSLDHLGWFLGLRKVERDALAAAGENGIRRIIHTEPEEKFALLINLGVIKVPEGFVSSVIWKKVRFSSPSRILKPGDKLLVKAYRQTVSGVTTSKERMAFLERCKEGNVYLGAQGASLVYEQKRNQLFEGFWYASFDHEENLPPIVGGHGVPGIHVKSSGDCGHHLGSFSGSWNSCNAFFGFSDFIEKSPVT